MEHNPVVWFEIYVEDLARAKAFYEELLNTELEEAKMDELEMWIFPHDIEKTGATSALVRHETHPPNLHGTPFYFPVPDCGERQSWAEAKNRSV